MVGRNLREEFEQNGFCICKKVFSESEVNSLLEDIKSANLRYEKDALTRGAMTFHSSIFFHSPALQKFISQQKIIDLLQDLVGPDVWVRWDQAVAKAPGADTFPWHQDNSYSRLKDPHYQFWIALTEMTADNGGLWLQPGSHRYTSLPHQRVGHEAVYDGVPESPILIEAQPGDVVIFSSFTLHCTTPNTTQTTRWAYVAEYMSLEHYDPYVEPPYFVVARNGKSCPEFVETYPGKTNPLNQLKYLGVNWSPRQMIPGWMKRAKRALLAGSRSS